MSIQRKGFASIASGLSRRHNNDICNHADGPDTILDTCPDVFRMMRDVQLHMLIAGGRGAL